jgi:hypothetical protein
MGVSDPRPFADVVDQVVRGGAPKQIRAAAARGALPLPRAVLVRLYIALREDEDEQVRRDASASLTGLDEAAVREVLADRECPPEVLSYYAERATKNEALAERITFHPAAPAQALIRLAAQGNSAVIQLVLTNQERLLAQPDLLNVLSLNPALQAEQRGRILELLERVSRASEQGARPASEQGAPEEELLDELREAARLLDIDVGELYAASEILDGEEFEQSEDPDVRTAYRKILTLNAAQKAILAMRGGREERMILVRDTNKMVALGVLRNPRVQEDDIELFSSMRNVSADVLRAIGLNREWAKNYKVIRTLVNNPRTPQGISTNFIPRLQNQDLKKIIDNRDVPELIRRSAKRTLTTRTQKTADFRGR